MKSFLVALLLAPAAFAADVSGYVYRLDGSVVEGATVRAGNATASTNGDGAFALENLAAGVVELEIEAKGAGSARPLVLTGDIVSITLTEGERLSPWPPPRAVAPGEGIVRGRVTVDGKALGNAPVVVGAVRVLTNAKGEYAAKGLAPRRYPVMIDGRLFPRLRPPHGGRMNVEGMEPYVADLSKTRESVINVELRAAPMIRGRVVDAEGEPVAHAGLQLVLMRGSSSGWTNGGAAERTRPDGRFAFPAPEETDGKQMSVAVTPLLHSTMRSKPFTVGEASRDLEITLPRFETVRIRVRDREGDPIPGARVAVASRGDGPPLHFLVERELAERTRPADSEGELVVQMASDTYDFVAVAPGFQTATRTSKKIAEPLTVDITLAPAAIVNGRVHRGDHGVEGVSIMIIGEGGSRTLATTGEDGSFEIAGLAPGTHRLDVVDDRALIHRTIEAQAPGEVEVELPAMGTLRGRVLDAATNLPLREDIIYTVYPVNDQQRPHWKDSVYRRISMSDGTFTMEIAAGTYRVTAGAAGYTWHEPEEVRIAGNETTTIDLPLGRGVTVSGRVTDETGLPVAGANVRIIHAERELRPGAEGAQTAEDGTFTLTALDPGEALLTVGKPGYVIHRKTVAVEGTRSIDVQLTRGLAIQGIVTRDGKPVPGAQVDATTPAIGSDRQAVVTDGEGRFTFSGLIPAPYTVSARLQDQHAEMRDVDPTRQKDVVISLDQQPKGVIYGTVTGISPPAHGRVVVFNESSGSAEGAIDATGNYRIENAPLGTVQVAAVVEGESGTARISTRREVESVAGEPLRVDLDLGANVRVSGRVTLDGNPVAEAEIHFQNEAAAAGARSGEDGSYELRLAAPGRYHIQARSGRFGDRHFGAVRDIRGGETIDIDLREQVIEGTVIDAVNRQPMTGALVTLVPASGTPMRFAGEVSADGSGRFRMVSAFSGPHRLIASAPGYAHRVQMMSSTVAQYAFEMSPAPDLRVRVLDARTSAPLEAEVAATDAEGLLPVRPRRSGDGTTYLFSLAPGNYRLMVMVRGYALKLVDVTAPGAVDIPLE